MTNFPHGKVTKLFESRTKLEIELNNVQVSIQDAVQAADRCVGLERLVSTSLKVLAKAVAKNEQVFAPADKTSR